MSDAPATAPDEAASVPEPPSRHGCPLTDSHGQAVLHPTRQQYVGVVRALLDEGFEIVVNLLSMSAHERIRLRVQVPADDPSIDSLFDLHPGTEAMEREVFDMFG